MTKKAVKKKETRTVKSGKGRVWKVTYELIKDKPEKKAKTKKVKPKKAKAQKTKAKAKPSTAKSRKAKPKRPSSAS